MKAYQQNVLPSIQQSFADMNASSSSALNQALAQSASDLSTSLGSQYGQFYQGQQNQQLNALNSLLGLLTAQTAQPIVQQKQGIAGPLLGLGASAFGAGRLFGSGKGV